VSWYQWAGEDLTLNLRIQPKASRDEWVGPYGDAYKVRITAPPVDGKANTHLIKFVAKTFGVSPSQVSLLAGEGGRSKRLCVHAPRLLPLDIKSPR
jgi:uncharacterized protein (TIGR00251 family)